MDGLSQVSQPQMISQFTESIKFQKLAFFLELVTLCMLRLATRILFERIFCFCFGEGLEQVGLNTSSLDVLHLDLDMLDMSEILQLEILSVWEISLVLRERKLHDECLDEV